MGDPLPQGEKAGPLGNSRPKRNRIEWLLASIVLLGLTAFLLRNWLGEGLPSSARREVLTELTITWMFKEELLDGRLLSEWNPYWFSGFPWLRYLSYPLYYMVAALSAWGGLSLEKVLVLFYFVVMAGSGLAMFGYLHKLLGDWRAALVGAVIYETFPYHNHVGVETWIHAAFWVLLPLALWLMELCHRTNGLKRIHHLLLTGVVLGCFPVISSEYAILVTPLAVIYLALREVGDVRRGKRSALHAVGGYVLVGLVAVGIAAFFVIPGLLETRYVGINAKHGAEATLTNELLHNYSVTPGLVWYAIAKRLRLPSRSEGLPGLFQSFWSVAWYPGLIAPVLAILGLTALRRRFAARAALVGLILASLFAMGPTCPLNFFTHLPALGRLSPFRAVMLVVAFLSILSGFGMRWLLRRGQLFWQKTLPTWSRLEPYRDRIDSPRWYGFGHWALRGLTIVMLLLVVIDFLPSAAAYQTTDAYFSEIEREAYTWLAERVDQGRLWETSYLPRDQYLRTYSLSEAPLRRYVGYYDNGAPLYTWQQTAWTDLRTALHLHQVRYVMLREGEPTADQTANQLRDAGYCLVFTSDDVHIWENPSNGEYARLYGSATLDITQDFYHSFAALPGFVWRNIAMVSPSRAVLNEHDLREIESSGRYDYFLVDESEPDGHDTLMITSDRVASLGTVPRIETLVWFERSSYEDIILQVEMPKSGVLTVAESWYPHWRVQVDGQPSQILRVNWALLGVWLKPGLHQIVFHYRRPGYVYAGYAITLTTLIALLAWWTWYVGKLLRQPKPPLWADLNMNMQQVESASRIEDENRAY